MLKNSQAVQTHSLDTGWELLPDFVFRTTGFPFEWLEELRCTQTLAQAKRLLALEQEQDRLRDRFVHELFPRLIAYEQEREEVGSAVFPTLYKLRKRVMKNRTLSLGDVAFWKSRRYENTDWEHFVDEWNELESRRAEAIAAGEELFQAELARVRRVMMAKVNDPRFQEAVFLSSPSSFQRVIKYSKDWEAKPEPDWNSTARGAERMIFAYLQRFCAKNDTTSFFGPVNYGTCNAAEPRAIRRAFREGNVLGKRRVFIAHWYVKLLAQKLAGRNEILPHLKPRPNPLVRPLDSHTFHFHGLNRTFRLPDAHARVFLALDGEKTVSRVAAELSMDESALIALLHELKNKRLIDLSIPLSPVRVDALAELRDQLAALPPKARQAGEELIDRLEGFRVLLEHTPYPERVQVWEDVERQLADLVEEDTRRKGGALYADRTALYEDCAGTLSALTIGGPLYRALTGSFLTTLKLLTAAAVLKWMDYQQAGRTLYRKLAADGKVVRYIDMIPLFEQGEPEMRYTRQFQSRIQTLLRQRQEEHSGGELHISEEEVRDLLEPFQEEIERALAHLQMTLPSPDIMVAAPSADAVERGEFRLVLGELHDDCSTIFNGFMAYFADDPEALWARFEQRIQRMPQWERMATIITERRNKHVTPELPGHTILLSAVSTKEPAYVIPIHQVAVREIDGRLTLWANGKPLTLYPGDLHSAAHGCFSLPCVVPIAITVSSEQEEADVKRSPRIVVDGVVMQRERWEIPAEHMRADSLELKGFPLFVHMARKQMQFDLPDRFFVKWKAGEKPMYVDLSIPWSLEWMVRVAAQTDRVSISEMYPGPEHLWWHDDIGVHTFELRTGYVYDYSAGLRQKQEARMDRR
jgi:hypothetical protein